MYKILKTLSLSCTTLVAISALSACGGEGSGSSSSNTTPTAPPVDRTAPVLSFSPATLTVNSGATGNSTLSATDNVGVTSGPTVTCTNGGSFATNVFTAPSVSEDTTSVCTATASDAADNSGTASLTVQIIAPDTTSPVVSFDPSTITVESGQDATVTLTATDNVEVTSGPDVTCTNGGSFAGSTFTAPEVTSETTVVCTATAADAAQNSGSGTLTATIAPARSSFFQNISDTVTTDPLLAMSPLANTPNRLVGLSKNASNSVSAFAASEEDTGMVGDAVLTDQPTLGSIGTAPLFVVNADIDGLDENPLDMVVLDTLNEEIVGLSFNEESNTFDSPITRSVPNACSMYRGGGTRFVSSQDPDPVRNDILVGTTNGLFYVAAGFSGQGDGETGLAAPTTLVAEGNFCSFYATARIGGDTNYAVYDPDTQILSGARGQSGTAATYSEQFSFDLSTVISSNLTPLILEAVSSISNIDTLFLVLDDPQAGSVLVIVDVSDDDGVPLVFNLDMQSPTKMANFTRSAQDEAILVSPTSETAVYIQGTGFFDYDIQLIETGTGFDFVEIVAGAAAFGSSTQNNIIIRPVN